MLECVIAVQVGQYSRCPDNEEGGNYGHQENF